jgi:multiple sugar transport system ATP-binding protein
MIYVTHDQVEAMTMGQRIVVMEKGEILQVGEPLVVYNKPASIFVASFIGSPSINLVEAVASTNGPNQFDLVDLNCTVNAEDLLDTNTTIKSGTKVVVGIRPEALFIPSSEQQVYQKIVGKVEVVEPLGNETIVHIRVQETVLVARLPAQNLPTDGDQIEFSFDRKALSFFDSQSGKRL